MVMSFMNFKSVFIVSLFFICLSFFVFVLISLNNNNNDLNNLFSDDENMIVTTSSGIEVETEYTYINNNDFYVKIPKIFKELTDDEISSKYSGYLPEVVFSNDDSTVNVAFSLTDKKIKDVQIESYINYLFNSLKSNNEIINNQIYTVDDHTVGRIEFVNKIVDSEIYNNMVCFSYNDRLVIVSFNSTIELRDEWEIVGKFIINSLKFL